jgi:hypothetical protein
MDDRLLGAITLPDGTPVRGRGRRESLPAGPLPQFGLYPGRPSPGWTSDWPAEWIDWPDFRTPRDSARAAAAITAAYHRARAGERVEVACGGGTGRTGTVLACMAVLAGHPAADAVGWVRRHYRPRAVETPGQRRWVAWFAEQLAESPDRQAVDLGAAGSPAPRPRSLGRIGTLSVAARAGLAHWFFGNLYEAVVRMPERLAPGDRMFAAGSPVRYYLPAAPVTVGATLISVVRGWRRPADRPALTVAGACTVAGAALTGHLVGSVNRRLLGTDLVDPAERQRLIQHWYRVNGVRLLLAGTALVALEKVTRASAGGSP